MQTALSTNLLKNTFLRYEDNVNETGLYFQNDSKEEEIIHLENQKLSSGHHEQQGLEMLQKVGDNLDWKIGALRKEI